MIARSVSRIGFLSVLLAAAARSLAADPAPDYVIVDNDWNIPGSYMAQVCLMPLLANPHIKVLGLASVTGDCWRDEGTASLLRFLEDIGVKDIPVVNGAVNPLINTRERTLLWEKTYGFIFWKGAWNGKDRFPDSHPTDPTYIAPLKGGFSTLKPSSENASLFMIRQVHAHPHQVTIFAAGPLTDIALAISLDPEFAGLAKQLIFEGCRISTLGNAEGAHSDFNILFDPEAAHITLAAHWPKITSCGDVGDGIALDQALMDRILTKPSPAGKYLQATSSVTLPLWEDVAGLVIADPSLVTKTLEVSADVETDHGMTYGVTVVGSQKDQPPVGVANLTIIREVDKKKLTDEFVESMQAHLER